jgi:hypothetical protein
MKISVYFLVAIITIQHITCPQNKKKVFERKKGIARVGTSEGNEHADI